ncbi:hypothetical protein CH376_06050 [Leptospira adleri]|uniref:Uncharacterized protein n=1 Tax=Leptospira adleri TaxID=2023186 RepID=A0ABX4P190_9LEPT|nr:hypothetical protein CH376_06050 [Leptospira adleri]
MNSFLLWWNLLSFETKISVILIFLVLIILIFARGNSVVSYLMNRGDFPEIQEIQLSPGSAYDSDCVPESGKSCP